LQFGRPFRQTQEANADVIPRGASHGRMGLADPESSDLLRISIDGFCRVARFVL
jgi:hypothetical protein